MSESTQENTVDTNRRRFLVATTSVVGGVGVVATAIPFFSSMWPSAATQAAGAPISVDISKLEPSQLITVSWRSRPIWILRRTEKQLATLEEIEPRLRDPDSDVAQQLPVCKNRHRSIKPEHFVAVAICTHLGCVPSYRPDIAPPDLGPKWEGGFFCPCHGSHYDLAARVYKDLPAPYNLPVPPYYYESDTVLRIGESEGGGDQNWSPVTW